MTQMSGVQTEAPRPPVARHGEPLWFDVLNEYQPEQGHYLEATAMVYLRRNADNTRWLIDGSTVDGYALDAANDQVNNDECICERPDECDRARAEADRKSLPNADELMHMLAEILGYTVTPRTTK